MSRLTNLAKPITAFGVFRELSASAVNPLSFNTVTVEKIMGTDGGGEGK
jgi:hypothetical protein